MKKTLYFLGTILCLLTFQPIKGQTYEYKEFETWLFKKIHIATLTALGNSSEYNIPATSNYNNNDYSVYAIGELPQNTQIKTIELGSNVGATFKAYFTSMTGTIDPKAFYNLPALQEFKLGNNNYFTVKDSVLYNKDATTLLAYPVANTKTTFELPKSITTINTYAGLENAINIQQYSVETGNTTYTALDGVLFDNNKTKLLFYPSAKTDSEYILPTTVKVIANSAKLNRNITSLKIKGEKPNLEGNQFFNEALSSNCTLYVPAELIGSYTDDSNWNSAFARITALELNDRYEQITVPSAGQLASVLGYLKNTLTHLKITGALNSTDILCLRDMTQSSKNGKLAYLDLTDATIVSGGGTYITANETNDIADSNTSAADYATENDLFPHCAFFRCDNLVSIVIPKRISEIGNSCLRECNNLEEVVMVHSDFTKIHHNAFRFSSKITSFSLPVTVAVIDNDAFVKTDGNREFKVNKGNPNFTTLNGVLFTTDKKELVAFPIGQPTTEYTVPLGTEIIRSCAFSYTKLNTLKMPYGLTTINQWAFEFSSFENLTLPSTLKEIKTAVFLNCSSIKNLYLQNPVPPTIDSREQSIDPSTCTLHVPYKKIGDYQQHSYWKTFKTIVELSNVIYVDKPDNKLEFVLTGMGIKPDTLTSIMIHGELDSDDIRYLRILGGVNENGEPNNNTTLKSIDLGQANIIGGGNAYLIQNDNSYFVSENDLGEYAFANTNIETFRFPATITNVHANTFKNCTELSCIAFNSLPDNLKTSNPHELLDENQKNGIIIINNDENQNYPENVIVSNNPNSVVKLIDKNNYALNEKLSLASCVFTKEFSKATQKGDSRGWETIILPFKPTEIRGFNKRGEEAYLLPFYSDASEFKDKGLNVLFFWLQELTDTGFKSVKFEEMTPYTPYIISMPNNSYDYNDTYNITGFVDFIANAENGKTVELNETIQPKTTVGNKFDLCATFKKMTNRSDVYVLNPEGTSFDLITGLADRTDMRVDAFEAYALAHPAFKGVKTFRVDGRPSIPSNLEHVMMNTSDNQKELKITRTGNGIRIISDRDRWVKLYSLDGRLIQELDINEGENFFSLPKGIYLIEREKVVVY